MMMRIKAEAFVSQWGIIHMGFVIEFIARPFANQSSRSPKVTAQAATVAIYKNAVFLPSTERIVVKAAAFVAGPVIRKTRATPGLAPFAINAAAMGTEAVAQTYTGIPRSIITSIAMIPPPRSGAK